MDANARPRRREAVPKVQNEYEVIQYAKLRHVPVGFEEIVHRNFHVHREFEFGLVLDGEARLSLRSAMSPLRRGSLFAINPNEPHEIIAEPQSKVRIAYVQIANSFCRDYLEFLHNLMFLEHDLGACLAADKRARVTRLLLNAIRDFADDGQVNTLHCMGNVIALLSALMDDVPYQLYTDTAYYANKKRAARIERVMEYVDSHFYEKVSLAELAQQEKMNVSYLSSFIHQQLGMTFQDYVNNVRLEKAIPLLLNTDKSPTDVSIESGFSDVRYMTRAFESRFGISPKAFREMQNAGGKVASTSRQPMQNYVSYETGMLWLEKFSRDTAFDLSGGKPRPAV